MSSYAAREIQTIEVDAGTRVGRRAFLTGAVTLAADGMARAQDGRERQFGPGAPVSRYPDVDLIQLDKRFAKYKLGNTPIMRLHTGSLWAEGIIWNGVGKYVVW